MRYCQLGMKSAAFTRNTRLRRRYAMQIRKLTNCPKIVAAAAP